MADEKIPMQPQPQAGQPVQQQVQIPVDATNRETVYFNFFQAHLGNDELFLDLSAYTGLITPSGPEPMVLTHRLIMNFVTAKRLAEVLRAAVARHEQVFGVVETDPARRLRAPMQPPRPPGT